MPRLSGSFWPNPIQAKLLAVAFATDDVVASLWRGLDGVQIETLEIGSLGLLPVVLPRLIAAGIEGDERLARLQGVQRNVWYRNQLQLHRLPQLVEALEDDGIEPLLLGGAPIAARYYEQPGLRPIVQLEVSVDPADGLHARTVLEQHGWSRTGGRDRGFALYQSEDGAARAFLHEGVPPFVAGPFSPRAVHAELRSRALRRNIAGRAILTLEPADELLVTCALGARRVVPQSPQWLIDAHRIVTTSTPPVEVVAERAAQFHLVPAVRDTFVYLAGSAEDPEIGQYAATLSKCPVSRRDDLVHALAGAGTGRFGAFPTTIVAHARATIATPLPRAVASLPRAFQAAWALDEPRQVPVLALRKALRRLRSPQPRNTSASS